MCGVDQVPHTEDTHYCTNHRTCPAPLKSTSVSSQELASFFPKSNHGPSSHLQSLVLPARVRDINGIIGNVFAKCLSSFLNTTCEIHTQCWFLSDCWVAWTCDYIYTHTHHGLLIETSGFLLGAAISIPVHALWWNRFTGSQGHTYVCNVESCVTHMFSLCRYGHGFLKWT